MRIAYLAMELPPALGRGPACPAPSSVTTNILPPDRQPRLDLLQDFPPPPPPPPPPPCLPSKTGGRWWQGPRAGSAAASPSTGATVPSVGCGSSRPCARAHDSERGRPQRLANRTCSAVST